MPLPAKAIALPVALTGGLLLAACGDTIDNEQVYAKFESDCAPTFTEQGGPANLAEPFCDCSIAEVRERELGPMDLIDAETMTGIGEQCMAEVLEAQGGAALPVTE